MSNLQLFLDAVNRLCKAYENGDFVPLLEADIAGYLYHLLVSRCNGDASRIHLSARTSQPGAKRKFPDIVIGPLLSTLEQRKSFETWLQATDTKTEIPKEEALKVIRLKTFAQRLRPRVEMSELAVEIKQFLQGFNNQQLYSRMKGAEADIKALATEIKARERLMFLFDEVGFLVKSTSKNHLQRLVRIREQYDPGIHLIYVTQSVDSSCTWHIVDSAGDLASGVNGNTE